MLRRFLIVFCLGSVAQISSIGYAGKAAFSGGNDEEFDILIKNAKILDGTGNPWFRGDIGISNDNIVRIGDLSDNTTVKIIDAAEYVVCPGFIDMHTHCDGGLGRSGSNVNLNYLIQGTTTVVTGNCGSAVSLNAAETKKKWEQNGIGTNAVFLVGHGDIRERVMGNEPRIATQEEIEKMKVIARQAMEDGAWGISTVFEYIPGLHSNTEEVIEIVKVVSEFGGVHASHVRYENAKIVDAIKETIRISREAKIRSNVAHLKVAGKRNWGLMQDVVKVFEKARADGIEIYADQYPYIQSAPIGSISSFISIPRDMEPLSELRSKRRDRNLSASERKAWDDQYNEEFKKAMSDPAKRERIRKLTEEGRPNNPSAVAKWGWQDFSVMVSDKYPQYVGKNFIDIAAEDGRNILDIVAEFMIEEPRMLYAGGSQSSEDHAYALKQDWVMVSSDGGASRLVKDTDRPARGHPRDFGSQAKILRKFVREDKLLTLENAIRKMSSLPASYLQLKKRGLLLEGYKADIAIFNPQTIRDNATYENAQQYATGVEYVIVNGKVSVDKGKYNGALNGKLLLLKQQKHP